MPINYELVYKARKASLNTNSLANIRVTLRNEADRKAEEIHKKYTDWLKAALPKDTSFEITNIACGADGIIGCVYTWQGLEPPRGVGKKVCCFCGTDDFD